MSLPVGPLRTRPPTQSGYRFGHLSMSSFFTRHNPHPQRVKHIQGLLHTPVCTVIDDGYYPAPTHSSMILPKMRLPVNSLNFSSPRHPVNTVTGLLRFTGLRNFYGNNLLPPRPGTAALPEDWRDELHAFTEALGVLPSSDGNKLQYKKERPRTGADMYSQETGRLKVPPSRAMRRHGSQQRERTFNQQIMRELDIENKVLTMLCQILQTDDVSNVQRWLMFAEEQDKALVMNLIRATFIGQAEYGKPAVDWHDNGQHPVTTLPSIRESESYNDDTDKKDLKVDRLVLETPRENRDSETLGNHGNQNPKQSSFLLDLLSTDPAGRTHARFPSLVSTKSQCGSARSMHNQQGCTNSAVPSKAEKIPLKYASSSHGHCNILEKAPKS